MVKHWYSFLRFLGYGWYEPQPIRTTSGRPLFYQRALNEKIKQMNEIDWTQDTVKVALYDNRLWGDWRWHD